MCVCCDLQTGTLTHCTHQHLQHMIACCGAPSTGGWCHNYVVENVVKKKYKCLEHVPECTLHRCSITLYTYL